MINPKPILKGKKLKVRILRPSEYMMLRNAVPKTGDQINLDACLLTGARFTECVRIQRNREWFDGHFIQLPWIPELGSSRHPHERDIRLSNLGKRTIPLFLDNTKRLPSVQRWDLKLKTWASATGLGDEGITARTLRKTWESWLMFSFPQETALILLSQGHTLPTSVKHYISLPFIDEDKIDMWEWVVGWAPRPLQML